MTDINQKALFASVLFAAIFVFLGLRMYFRKKCYVPGHQKVLVRELPRGQHILQVMLGLSMILLPLLWATTESLYFADINLGLPARELGIVVVVVSLFFLWWTHATLAHNWSPSVEIREGHTLTRNGPFRYVRHPMYTAFFFFYASFLLLSANWLVGLLPVMIFFVILKLRLPMEEVALENQFGELYTNYKSATKRFIPFVW